MNCNSNTSIFCTVGRTMRSITILLEGEFRQKGIDINLSQFIILNILSTFDDLILEDLSKLIHKDKSAVMRHVNHLELNDFVTKMKDESDKRRKVLILTEKGIEVLKNARRVEKKLQENLTKELEKKDIAVFSKVLGHMKDQAVLILDKNH